MDRARHEEWTFKHRRLNLPTCASFHEYKYMRMPGVEPGSQAWEACMMPLHYMRSCCKTLAVRMERERVIMYVYMSIS